mmetsp:Transcript_9250/g.13957  ORF Transcript_9250/g.13957 Transcript_9250/m.13957 type:complete len:88 (+) Transcript_9250:282-545(+)
MLARNGAARDAAPPYTHARGGATGERRRCSAHGSDRRAESSNSRQVAEEEATDAERSRWTAHRREAAPQMEATPRRAHTDVKVVICF